MKAKVEIEIMSYCANHPEQRLTITRSSGQLDYIMIDVSPCPLCLKEVAEATEGKTERRAA